MAFQERGFIDWLSFLTYEAQLRTFTIDAYGQPVASAVSTVPIIVFTEKDEVLNTTPLVTGASGHYACIPSSYAVQVDDHIRDVTDPLGAVVLADARVQVVDDLNHHRCGARIKVLRLEIPLA